MKIHRREFLARSGPLVAGALAFGSAPSMASGRSARNRPPSGAEKITCAMIGAGGRGHALMNWALSHPRARFTAICDVNQQNLNRAAATVEEKQGEKPRRFGDFRRLLDDASIDAVIVATPHHWHCPIAVRALDAGKHVYLEKPASHVLREGRRLVNSARKSKRVVQHGTQMRSSEVTLAAAEVLSSGILGEIKMAKAWGVEPRTHHPPAVPDASPPDWLDYEMWLGPAPYRPFNPDRFRRWNAFRDYGNGEIGGDGIHDIDMARWGLGVKTHPVRAIAHGSRIHVRGESDFPDNMMVSYQYAEGKVLIYENRNFAPYKMHGWDNGNIFYGTDGYMVFSRRGFFQTYLGAAEEEGPGMRGGAGNEEHVHNFLDAVGAGRATRADADTAHLSCALVHLGEVSYRLGGRPLRFEPQAEKVVGDDEADAMLSKSYRGSWGFDGA